MGIIKRMRIALIISVKIGEIHSKQAGIWPVWTVTTQGSATFQMLKNYIIKGKIIKCLVDYAKYFAIMILVT